MKTVKIIGLMSIVCAVFAGSATAEEGVVRQNIAKRPLLEQTTVHADQAWVGASLKSEPHLHAFQALTNLQFVSKRAYLAPISTD